MKNIELAKRHAGLLALLEHKKMLSMTLAWDYRKNIQKGCGDLSDKEMEDCIKYAQENIHFDSSVIFVDWK